MISMKLQSIYEIWKGLNFRLPFIVKRDCWTEGTFFVVRRIPYRGSVLSAFGDLYRGGQFIKCREGDVLPLSNRRVWVRLPFSWMPCVAIEAGICPIPEMQGAVCDRVHKCSCLDEWMLHVSYANEESEDDEE
jgi:hypothetical protein